MSDFLTRLAQRQLGQIATIEPRVASLYSAASESGNPSLDYITEHRPPPDAQEAVMMPESTTLQASARSPTDAKEMKSLVQKLLVHDRAGSHDPMPQIEAHSFTTESQSTTREPFTKKTPVVRIANTSADQTPIDLSPPSQLKKIEALPQEKMPFVSNVKTAPVTPSLLVNSTKRDLAPRLNESTDLALLVKSSTTDSVSVAPRLSELTAPTALAFPIDRVHEQEHHAGEAPVHVTIGRIEVTAVTQPVPPKRSTEARKPSMSLDDYLARRQRRQP